MAEIPIFIGYLVAHPTNRKWVITPVIDVDYSYLSHVNNWGYNPLTIRGMSHQVSNDFCVFDPPDPPWR